MGIACALGYTIIDYILTIIEILSAKTTCLYPRYKVESGELKVKRHNLKPET